MAFFSPKVQKDLRLKNLIRGSHSHEREQSLGRFYSLDSCRDLDFPNQGTSGVIRLHDAWMPLADRSTPLEKSLAV